MLNRKTITLAIPCKNEEASILALLKKVPECVDEVLVIDNNSTDKTRAVAKKAGAKVFTEHRQINGIGYGFAHQRAMKEATSDYLITMDGDNTYPLSDIKKMIQFAEKNQLDFVSGNRFPLKNSEAISKIRQLGVWILNEEVRLLYGYPMQDILSGMWLMNRQARKKLHSSSGDWNFSPEIKLDALLNSDIKFGEFHIHHHVRAGESKQVIWKTGFEHLFYILYRKVWLDLPHSSLFTLSIEN